MSLTKWQIYSLKKLFGNIEVLNEYDTGSNFNAFEDIDIQTWQAIRDFAYPYWQEDDWTINEAFISAKERAIHRLQIKNGQMELF
jgi:hypothetical protein